MNRVIENLYIALTKSNDLRHEPWKDNINPLAGHCYIACEVLRYLLGPEWYPMFIRHEGQPHWFLSTKKGRILDPTVSQFLTQPDYSKGKRHGFLTKNPSKRARVLLKRMGML